ncbi:MAG TPA: hypothetical protein VF505_15560 [Thermoanaerobaculia bacterium]|jgi:hypothetical protein
MTCDKFRAQFVPGSADAAMLEHIRSCDVCLNFAVERDDDMLFRALGGDDMVPPGGIDAFVGDVMREVHLRGTENTVSGPAGSWTRRLAVAAALATVVAGSTFVYEHRTAPAIGVAVTHHQFRSAAYSRPVIQSYDSQKATIVEVPSEGEDVTVVMVFDDSLPADL